MFSVIWSSCVGFRSIYVHVFFLLLTNDSAVNFKKKVETYISPNFTMYLSKLPKEFVCTCVSNQTIQSAIVFVQIPKCICQNCKKNLCAPVSRTKPFTRQSRSHILESAPEKKLHLWNIMKQVSLNTCEVVKSKTLKKMCPKS